MLETTAECGLGRLPASAAAMAMDTAWTISTARSPTTWQPRIMHVARSTISLQNPVVRPSMIVRAVVSKRTVVTTTSCDARAFASVSPTWAYSGSVKLPIGFTWSGSVVVGPRTALVAATRPSCKACGTNIKRPVMSPAAKTCGAEVRR